MKTEEKNIIKKDISSTNLIEIVYVIASILLAIPSVLYLIKNKTIYYFSAVFTYTLERNTNMTGRFINTIIYLSLFFILFFCYFYLLKNHKKVFKNKKNLFVFIFIIGLLFTIIVPTTSLDVYSYIANGYIDSNYNENPYYTSVEQITNQNGPDKMLGKVARCWRNEPVVYGPAWSLICKILTSFSFRNITIALYVFKLAFFIVYLFCSMLMYKITKKKFFTMLFALNPFILFEALSNVHNDIFLILFVLLAIYFIKNKKNIALSVACIAVATAIKYLSILLLPFIIIYGLKDKDLKTRIIRTVLYAIEFILIIVAFYAIYIRDIQVLAGIFVQQNKYGRSIFLVLWYLLNGDDKALTIIKAITLGIFSISYICIVLKLFFNKKLANIKFRKIMQTYQVFLLIFTFVLITNFNAWYVMWIIPTLFLQKAKNIRITLYLTLGVLNSYAITYATGIDNETVGIPYMLVAIITVLSLMPIKKK